MKKRVGKIKSIKYAEESRDLEVTILITDPKFRKKLLRDLSLSGNLEFEGDKVMFISEENEDAEI